MDHFKFINLASSSSGNCYYLELDRGNEFKPFKLVLEAGISWKDFIKKTVENQKESSEQNVDDFDYSDFEVENQEN